MTTGSATVDQSCSHKLLWFTKHSNVCVLRTSATIGEKYGFYLRTGIDNRLFGDVGLVYHRGGGDEHDRRANTNAPKTARLESGKTWRADRYESEASF